MVESRMHVVDWCFQPDIASAADRLVANHEHAILILDIDILLNKQSIRVIIRMNKRPTSPLLHLLFKLVKISSGDFQIR